MNFKYWCNEQGFFSKSNLITHLFMDGGKLYVPNNKLLQFFTKYIEHVNNGEDICLVEKLGKNVVFRFFLDIDFKKIDKSANISTIINTANNTLNLIGDVYKCSENKGYHLIYNKPVTHTEACNLYDSILEKLPHSLHPCIDKSVYSTGLRCVGSTKFSDGKILHRCYKSITDESSILDWKSFKYSIVRIKELPLKSIDIQYDTEFPIVQKYIEKISSEYKNCTISNYKKIGDYISFTTNSKWCTNKKDFHINSKIYFVLSPQKTIYQKCFCPCNIHRCFSTCSTYKSKPVKISDADYKKIIQSIK